MDDPESPNVRPKSLLGLDMLQQKSPLSDSQTKPPVLKLNSENSRNTSTRGSKIFRNPPIPALNTQLSKSSTYRSNKTHTISSLSNQLNDSVGLMDNQMKQLLEKQKKNFLIAYRGIVQEISADMNRYKLELEKRSQSRVEVENSHLRKLLKVFEDEVDNMLAVAHKFEEENRVLRKKIVELSTDLKAEKELAMSVGRKNRMHKELAKLFYNENKQIIMAKIEDVNRAVNDLEGADSSGYPDQTEITSNGNEYSEGKPETTRSFYRTQADNSPAGRAGVKPSYNLRVNTKGYNTSRTPENKDKIDLSMQSDSSRYQHRNGLSEQSITRALQGILENRLKPQFNLLETIHCVLEKAKAIQKAQGVSGKANQANLVEDGLRNVSRSVFDDREEFSPSQFANLRKQLTKCIERAIKDMLTEAASPLNHSSNSPENNISQQDLLDVFINEKEVNLAVHFAINAIRTKNTLNTEISFPLKESINLERLRTNNEDSELLSEIKLTDGNVESTQQLSARSNLNTRRLFTDRDSQMDESTDEAGIDSTMMKNKWKRPLSSSRLQSHERQSASTERTSNSKLRSILKEKIKTNAANEAGYLNTGNGTFRSKSPLTKRVVITNGKLLVGNNTSLSASPYKFDPNGTSWN